MNERSASQGQNHNDTTILKYIDDIVHVYINMYCHVFSIDDFHQTQVK